MNIQALMKQAQSLQKDMLKVKGEIDSTIFKNNSGFVDVEVNGKKEILNISINSDSLDNDDVEVLADMIMVALNGAFKEVDKVTEQKMSKYSNIPGMF